MSLLTMENPVFAAYAVAAALMILKLDTSIYLARLLPFVIHFCGTVSGGGDGEAGWAF